MARCRTRICRRNAGEKVNLDVGETPRTGQCSGIAIRVTVCGWSSGDSIDCDETLPIEVKGVSRTPRTLESTVTRRENLEHVMRRRAKRRHVTSLRGGRRAVVKKAS